MWTLYYTEVWSCCWTLQPFDAITELRKRMGLWSCELDSAARGGITQPTARCFAELFTVHGNYNNDITLVLQFPASLGWNLISCLPEKLFCAIKISQIVDLVVFR